MKPVPKVGEQSFRLPEQGRIRFGMKHPQRKFPMSLDTFRFTSPDRNAIEKVAEVFGGDPKPWNEPRAQQKHQWEVLTRADCIDVWALRFGALKEADLSVKTWRDRQLTHPRRC